MKKHILMDLLGITQSDLESKYYNKPSISKGNEKIGKNTWNFSTVPGFTCSSKACRKKCYAFKFYNMYPSVRKCWNKNAYFAYCNMQAIRREIERAYKAARNKPDYFRWHVSGDIINKAYFEMMVETALSLPEVSFLVMTKEYNVVNEWLNDHEKPANLQILFSRWGNDPIPNPHNLPTTNVVFKGETMPADGKNYHCPGKCKECGFVCWHLMPGWEVWFDEH